MTDEQIGGVIRNSFLTLVGQALEKDSSDNEGGPTGGMVETRGRRPRTGNKGNNGTSDRR